MILLEETFEVPGDVRDVLEYIADFSHLPGWDPSVKRVRRLDEGKELTLGARFLVSLKSLGRTVDVDYCLVELGPERATLVGKSAGVSAVDVIRTEQSGSLVRVCYRAEIKFLGLLRPMERLMRSRIQAGGRAAIANLTQVLRHRDVARRVEGAVPVAVA